MGSVLDWKELMGWPLPWRLSLGGAEKAGSTRNGSWLWPQGVVSGRLHPLPDRPVPTPLGRGKPLCCHQLCPKPPALFLSLPCLDVFSASFLVSSHKGRCQQGLRKDSKQLRVGHINLSLGAGPFVQPLPSPPNVPIATAPPFQLPFLRSCHQRKKSQCPGMGISRQLGISARQYCQTCPLLHGHRTNQILCCMLTMHFYECSFYRCF